MNKILFSAIKFSLMIIACSSLKSTSSQNMPKQGIQGYVYRVSGNQMPSPGVKPPPQKGFQTTLFIYQLTNLNQVQRQRESAFYYSIQTKLITKVQTDSTGYFEVGLLPGHYSLFAKKEKLFYANWFDKENNIAPVEVLSGKFSRVEFRVDYDAVY